jgi:hypothetical protein
MGRKGYINTNSIVVSSYPLNVDRIISYKNRSKKYPLPRNSLLYDDANNPELEMRIDNMRPHDEVVKAFQEFISKRKIKCATHGNIGGAEPDLFCTYDQNPILFEIETIKSLDSPHTRKQVLLMNQYSDDVGADSLLIMGENKGRFCGISLNKGGEKIQRRLGLPKCSILSKRKDKCFIPSERK